VRQSVDRGHANVFYWRKADIALKVPRHLPADMPGPDLTTQKNHAQPMHPRIACSNRLMAPLRLEHPHVQSGSNRRPARRKM